jgi:N utilization substance protein B
MTARLARHKGTKARRHKATGRRKARILAVQALTQLDVQGDAFLEELDVFFAHSDLEPNEATRSYARDLVRKCWADRASMDATIVAVAEHWSLERMSPVDRNAIRVALAEMADGVQAGVAMNEAIEIAREYGSAESPRFVNGVLDAIHGRETQKRINAETQKMNDEGSMDASVPIPPSSVLSPQDPSPGPDQGPS